MYGRGTSDDKGPAVAALYAMKAVKEAGMPLQAQGAPDSGLRRGKRLGGYGATTARWPPCPRMGFSPDASYPIINIEKGICRLELHGVLSNEGLQVHRL